jgi:radical SAM-linked protein
MSQGFTSRPKIVFALALALGIEAWREVVDIELSEPCEPASVLRRLAAVAPAGFDWLEVEALPAGAPPPRPVAVEYHLPLPRQRQEPARDALCRLLVSSSWTVTRRRPDRDREVSIDLRPLVLDADVTDLGVLRARLRICPDRSVRPEELLESLGLRDLLDQGSVLARTDVELA